MRSVFSNSGSSLSLSSSSQLLILLSEWGEWYCRWRGWWVSCTWIDLIIFRFGCSWAIVLWVSLRFLQGLRFFWCCCGRGRGGWCIWEGGSWRFCRCSWRRGRVFRRGWGSWVRWFRVCRWGGSGWGVGYEEDEFDFFGLSCRFAVFLFPLSEGFGEGCSFAGHSSAGVSFKFSK